MTQIVQSVVIPKSKMSRDRAMQWVKARYELNKMDETGSSYMFKQYEPKHLKKLGFTRYYTVKLYNGVDLVMAVMDDNPYY